MSGPDRRVGRYARQLHDRNDLPAGSFATQFTFAQTLTESVKAVDNCLLVISLPASETDGSRHTYADDAEVGGPRGRDALQQLRNVIGRVEVPWRPASAEEELRDRAAASVSDLCRCPRSSRPAMWWRAGSPTLYRTQQQEFSGRVPARRLRKADQGVPIPSIPRYSIGSTRTGPRWRSSSVPAACCA